MFDDGDQRDPVHPVVGVVRQAEAVFDESSGVDVSSVDDDVLAAVLVRCHGLAARQSELMLRLVGEVDSRDLGRRLGASSTTAWLRDVLLVRPGAAKGWLDLAHRLRAPDPVRDWAPNPDAGSGARRMPATLAGLVAGQVSLDHALVIAKTMAQFPVELSDEDAARAEEDLAAFAAEHDPVTLQRLAAHLLHVLASESLDEREERARRKRRLRLVDQGDGTVRITGLLSNEDAAVVRTALDPLAAPALGEDGERDERAPEQRMADALVELCRRQLTHADLPTSHGHPPQLVLLAELATLLAHHNSDTTDHSSGDAGSSADTSNSADAGESEGGERARGVVGEPVRGCAQTRSRRWLHDTWAHRFGVAPAELTWGGPVSTEALRRICCDAAITPVLVDQHGIPLRVGRAERCVTPGIWTALVARDRGCAFPGCTRPPAWCVAHHVHHWADGGPTDLENMVLICGHHHRSVHHNGWDVHLGTNGHPEFLPPPWIDPDRVLRRNTQPRHDHQPPPHQSSRIRHSEHHHRQDQRPPPNGQHDGSPPHRKDEGSSPDGEGRRPAPD